ncbi:amiloride-sensitive sodium channel subunit alpha-like [Dendronephthya gigantea]|uniref:amiloride-sensitive sodium channel subunit alpha-like n=1 Tax=Dendronephthya gigantea TaxID=151771 RepID=UPI00106C494E|nr:amiloride-sensitive sodium channel subunit alpha-like [Dendronephthya gigantea]
MSTEKEMAKQRSLRDILVDFMGYTTGHGFARLVAATSIAWRIFWVVAVLGAFGMFVFEVSELFKLFLSRPVQTSVTVTFEKQLKFPAVTICNLNLIKASQMNKLPDELVEKFAYDYFYSGAAVNGTSSGNFSSNSTQLPGGFAGHGNVNAAKSGTLNSSIQPTVVVNFTSPMQPIVNVTNVSATRSPSETLHVTSQPIVNVTSQPTEVNSASATQQSSAAMSSTVSRKRRKKQEVHTPSSSGENKDPKNEYSDSTTAYGDAWNYDYTDTSYSDIADEYPDDSDLSPEAKLRLKIESYIGAEDPKTLFSLGHYDADLIKGCTWKGVDCATTGCKNLSKFWSSSWNYRYGNCYTFNNGVDQNDNPTRVLKSSKPGPSQGLVLELDIEENEYIGELSHEAGVRVALHEQGVMHFPFEEGFSVAPGMVTSVGLSRTMMKRLDRFSDGSCLDESVPLSQENLYRKNKNVTRYSLQVC